MMRFEHPMMRLPRRYCAETIAAEVAALGPAAWVPHPGKLPGNDAVLLITPGGQLTNAFAGPMAPTPHLRRCSYISEIMADLGGVWGRSRIMGLAPGAQVPPHVDVNYYWRTHLRIHIPIVTNPKVFFTCGGEKVHMDAGECWIFDSFQMHNVVNGGSEKRLHLVLDTVGGEALWDIVARAEAPGPGLSPLPPVLKPGTTRVDGLAFERMNAPGIMSPWEVRCHIDFLLGHVRPTPTLDRVAERLEKFHRDWAAAWAQFGPAETGLPAYHRIVARAQVELSGLGAHHILLGNDVPLDRAVSELIFKMAAPPPRAQPMPGAAPALQPRMAPRLAS